MSSEALRCYKAVETNDAYDWMALAKTWSG